MVDSNLTHCPHKIKEVNQVENLEKIYLARVKSFEEFSVILSPTKFL